MKARHIFRLAWIIAVALLIVAARQDPYVVDTARSLEAPSAAHWAGTDRLGRDVFSRTSNGLQLTVQNVIIAECLGASAALLFAGLIVGLGFKNPRTAAIAGLSTLSLRMVPPLLIAITVAVLLRGSAYALVSSLAILSFAYAAPFFEGELNGARHLPQLEGATILGAPRTWQLRSYIFPAVGPRIGRYVLLDAMSLVAYEALFGFFGLTEPTTPSLGGLISEARLYLVESPWLFFTPACVLILVLSGAWQASISTDWR